MNPIPAVKAIIPKIESHTIQPARHFKAYIKTNDTITAKPNAANNHCQLFFISLIKFPKDPELAALENFSTAEFKAFLNESGLGTQILSITEVDTYRRESVLVDAALIVPSGLRLTQVGHVPPRHPTVT